MNSEKYFIYVGNAYPHKNLEMLIKSIVLLNIKNKSSVKLKIVSSRSIFLDRLRKFVENANAKSYVDLLGYVEDKKLKDLYKNSVAFVFPTLAEGFGLPPMEAIEAGTLAVVSDIPVLKEVYGDSVNYFNPKDVNSIVEALREAININLTQREIKLNYAKRYLKKYSWYKMAQETLRLYKEVLK